MKIDLIDPVRDGRRIIEGLAPDFADGALRDLIARTTSRDPALFVAAVDVERVAGLLCYRTHRLDDGSGDGLMAAQAAGALTSRDYRGMGIFPTIIRHGEEILRSRKFALIFGFPNENAYPVWSKKVLYDEVRLVKWRAPAAFGAYRSFVSNDRFDLSGAVYQDDDDLIASKRKLYGDDLISVAAGGSSAWAIKRPAKILGSRVFALDIGGIRCAGGDDCKSLIARLVRRAGLVSAARLTTTASHPMTTTLRASRPATAPHEVMIFRWLEPSRAGTAPFAFFSGITDWF